MDEKEMRKRIEFVLNIVDKLPIPKAMKDNIKEPIEHIKELLMNARPPKIMFLGRRGAGKSSLINAIFKKKMASVGSVLSETGQPTWYSYKDTKGSIKILDTRGLGDKSKPESANFENAIEEITEAIKSDCPDAILFLCKAKEVDAHISEDIKNIINIRSKICNIHNYDPPVFSVITQVDELDPVRIEPPYNDETKKNNIDEARLAILKAFDGTEIKILEVIPISAYAEYIDGKIKYERFWNIDKLLNLLVEDLPRSAQLEMARIAQIISIQKKIARKLIAATATACAGIAAVPIPIADIAPITSLQIIMIMGIGHIGGHKMSKKTAAEFITAAGVNVGAAFVFREGARALIKIFMPGAGSVISAGVAFAGTWAIGEAAIAYFIAHKSMTAAKEKGKEAWKKHKKNSP
jgi:predicted GTPase